MLVVFVLSWCNIKQVSYVSRITLALVVIVAFYVLLEALFTLFYQSYLMPQNLVNNRTDFKIEKDIYPNFFIFVTQGIGLYEGAPIVPALFVSARHKGDFQGNVMLSIGLYGVFTTLFSIVCLYAYKDQIEEVILLNLSVGGIQVFFMCMFITSLTHSYSLNLIPVLDIIFD